MMGLWSGGEIYSGCSVPGANDYGIPTLSSEYVHISKRIGGEIMQVSLNHATSSIELLQDSQVLRSCSVGILSGYFARVFVYDLGTSIGPFMMLHL